MFTDLLSYRSQHFSKLLININLHGSEKRPVDREICPPGGLATFVLRDEPLQHSDEVEKLKHVFVCLQESEDGVGEGKKSRHSTSGATGLCMLE